jgi:hypothetical protein
MDARPRETQELRRQIESALARTVDPSDVLPMLHRLARLSDEGSDENLFANMHLAGLLVERDPWRAALCARRVVARRPEDDRGWATLALCQTLLGNYNFAVSAYRQALSRAPKNPWYAHNLGHLLDVALGRSADAIAWLRRAYQHASHSGEVAASYAHALARSGRLSDARKVLGRAMKRTSCREHFALLRWLELGAPADQDRALPRPAAVHAIAIRALHEAGHERLRTGARTQTRSRRSEVSPVPTPKRSPRSAGGAELDVVLTRGLSSLPLDAKQRARARSLARDAGACFPSSSAPPTRGGDVARSRALRDTEALAAAVAYAIVYVDHIPLTQAEVAACFRVGVASLRGRFGQLRAHLDLTPGDVRYRTQRSR